MKAKLFRDVPFARTGWQQYMASELGQSGERLLSVFRSPAEVARSAVTFEGVPITMDHPASLLTDKETDQQGIGLVSSVRFDDSTGQLRGDLIIWDQEAIGSIASGVRELSGGYDAEYHPRASGELEQFNIKGNHVAIVPAGRSGSAQRIGA